MGIRHQAARIAVRCPAKINLFLEVLAKRPDGFHEVATVMAPVSLFDTLGMGRARRDRLEVRPGRSAPSDGTNTVLRALDKLRTIRRVPPVRVLLTKRIPAGAGLGGGSSDAWGAVRAADRLFGLELSPPEVRRVLASVGSDTAFFDAGGWALCTGRGEIVTPLGGGPRLPLVLVVPSASNPTAEIYRRFRLSGPRRSADGFLAALEDGAPLRARLFNRLEGPAFEFQPLLRSIRRGMAELPFEAVRMTGSGAALYGLCPDARRQKALARSCAERGWGRVFEVHTLGDRDP